MRLILTFEDEIMHFIDEMHMVKIKIPCLIIINWYKSCFKLMVSIQYELTLNALKN